MYLNNGREPKPDGVGSLSYFKIGCMLLYPLAYAETCNPDDVLAANNFINRHYFFSDVQAKGYYTQYMKQYFKKIILK